MTNQTPTTKNQKQKEQKMNIETLTPIDAAHAAQTTSEKYGFVSSRAICDCLADAGFQPRSIQIQRTNKDERRGFQKHIVRFRHAQLMPSVGDSFPEMLMINSHDGSSSLKLMLGVFRLVCSNGMVSGDVHDQMRFIHRKANLDDIHDGALRLIGRAGELSDKVERMKERIMTPSVTADFAEKALLLRYDKPDAEASYADQHDWDRKLTRVTWARRYEDRGDNLWLMFNRIQENLTQGRKHSGIRQITSPSKDVEINTKLWNLSQDYLLN